MLTGKPQKTGLVKGHRMKPTATGEYDSQGYVMVSPNPTQPRTDTEFVVDQYSKLAMPLYPPHGRLRLTTKSQPIHKSNYNTANSPNVGQLGIRVGPNWTQGIVGEIGEYRQESFARQIRLLEKKVAELESIFSAVSISEENDDATYHFERLEKAANTKPASLPDFEIVHNTSRLSTIKYDLDSESDNSR